LSLKKLLVIPHTDGGQWLDEGSMIDHRIACKFFTTFFQGNLRSISAQMGDAQRVPDPANGRIG